MTSESGDVKYYKDTFKNIMIVEGTTEKPYEVYTGGEPATEPSPEYPLPITSAGNYNAEAEKCEVGIGVTGKNLFDASKIPTKSQGGATVTNNGDGSFTISGSGQLSSKFNQAYVYNYQDTIKILKAGSLHLVADTSTYPILQIYIQTSSGVKSLVTNNLSAGGKTNNILQSVLDDTSSTLILQFYGNSGTDIKPGTIKPMLYQSGDSTWEPFKQQLSTLQIPNPFRGIPVDSGGIYTDSDGQQWICDYIDRERGKYVQCVQEIVFDGSDDEKWSTYDGAVYLGFKIALPKGKFDNRTIGMCDRFKNTGNTPVSSLATSIFYPNNFDGIMYITFDSDLFLDVSEFKEWLKSNQTKVVYPIGAQIEIDLTQEQLSALDLFTYQGITNIGTDTMPQVGMAVESRGFNLAGIWPRT